jgi:DNA-binding MarR family transcriptional regulator
MSRATIDTRRSPPLAAGAAVAGARLAATLAADAAAATGPAPRAPDALSLGVLADVLGFHVAQAAVTTYGSFERHVGVPFGLRKVEYSLLLLLLANGPLSPKRLGQALALSAPNLTLLLDRLQGRGLVRRERSATDGRSQNIVLTDPGRQLADASAAAAAKMEDELSDRLSRAERLMLIELLRKVAGR